MTTSRRAARAIAACCAIAVLTSCGAADADPPLTPAAGFDAAATLAEFDTGDSAASVAGDEDRLRMYETEPAVLFSIAASRNAAASGRPQPGFRHIMPEFALPADDTGDCFLAVANLQVDGDELPRVSALHFQRSDAEWLLSHNVVVGDVGGPALTTMTNPVAGAAQELPPAALDEIADAVFGGSIGTPPTSTAVAPSELVDGRLAGAVAIYRQQLETTGATLDRTLTSASWAPCTASTASGSLAFLVLEVRDEVTAAAGGTVTLAGENPDMVSTGHPDGLTAASITIDRLQVFLLAVPEDPAAGATVLGLNDAAVDAVTAG